MSRPIAAVRLVSAAILVLGAVACGGSGASPAASVLPSAASATPVAVVTATPTMTPDPPVPSLGQPPDGTMATDGGDPVTGSLGSFTWADGGSDSPWLPGATMAVGAGEELTVAVTGDVPVKDWVAKRVPAGTADGAGAVALEDGSTAPITFAAPPPGDWSVQVVVTFGDGLGSAAYYWHVTVT